jgi:hypothetical protein
LNRIKDGKGDTLTNDERDALFCTSGEKQMRASGSSEEEISAYVERGKIQIAELRARGAAVYRGIAAAEAARQADVETALVERNANAPGQLIDAIRNIKELASDAGASRGGAYLASRENVRDFIVKKSGEQGWKDFVESTRRTDTMLAASARAGASKLAARYRVTCSPLTTLADGSLKLNSFTLNKVAGDYAVQFDEQTSLMRVLRQGVDVTEAILKGGFFDRPSK